LAKLVRITVRRSDDQTETVQFVDYQDGVRGGLRFRWCAYDGLWRLWYLALDGSTISGPEALAPGANLTQGHRHDPRVPQGELFVHAPDRNPPNRETIDVSARVYYRPVEAI
jgi:hypothetical protein